MLLLPLLTLNIILYSQNKELKTQNEELISLNATAKSTIAFQNAQIVQNAFDLEVFQKQLDLAKAEIHAKYDKFKNTQNTEELTNLKRLLDVFYTTP